MYFIYIYLPSDKHPYTIARRVLLSLFKRFLCFVNMSECLFSWKGNFSLAISSRPSLQWSICYPVCYVSFEFFKWPVQDPYMTWIANSGLQKYLETFFDSQSLPSRSSWPNQDEFYLFSYTSPADDDSEADCAGNQQGHRLENEMSRTGCLCFKYTFLRELHPRHIPSRSEDREVIAAEKR